jgi:hypothetical protein
MGLNNLCVVVIPIHCESPTKSELVSFTQCFDVLNKHTIKIIAPIGLNLVRYKEVVDSFETIFIDPVWQSSIQNYNKLKLSLFFYNLFKDFDFLLTYELDAFVFKDEVDLWCSKNYDYIGAPWFLGYCTPISNKIIGVGNSGFSLRKISAMKNAIHNIYLDDRNYSTLTIKKQIKERIKKLLFYGNVFKKENNTIQNSIDLNEDGFIALKIPLYIKKFNIAPINEAIQFSFEVKPEYLYELNNDELPMGCHAWQKYNFEFWKPYIEKYGYSL